MSHDVSIAGSRSGLFEEEVPKKRLVLPPEDEEDEDMNLVVMEEEDSTVKMLTDGEHAVWAPGGGVVGQKSEENEGYIGE